jgi:hypothetical protein
MGQYEVYEFLKKNKSGWFTARDISKKLKASFGSIGTNLKKMRDRNEIMFKKIKAKVSSSGKKEVYAYKFKR